MAEYMWGGHQGLPSFKVWSRASGISSIQELVRNAKISGLAPKESESAF